MLADSILDQWLPVALASTVDAKPRQYKLLGQNIVVYRHRYGPAAFKDLCAHRGAALSNGWIADGNLTCPYHGWQYDRNGACVSIPSIAPGEKIPSTAKIAAYPTREAYGIVWVCLSSPAGDLAPWPDEAWEAPGFRVFCTGQYSRRGRCPTLVLRFPVEKSQSRNERCRVRRQFRQHLGTGSSDRRIAAAEEHPGRSRLRAARPQRRHSLRCLPADVHCTASSLKSAGGISYIPSGKLVAFCAVTNVDGVNRVG